MKLKIVLASVILILTGVCQAQEKPDSTAQTDRQVEQSDPGQSLVDTLPAEDVCRHWLFLAPVVHENMKMAKEFMPKDYMQNLEESYEMEQMHPKSGGYAILRAMLDAAEQGKSVAELEALALSTCKLYPEDAVDHAGGAYEKFVR